MFKVGDKVKVVGNSYDHCFELGQVCTVTQNTYSYEVEDVELRDVEVSGRRPWGEAGENVFQIMHNTDIELVKE